MSKEKTFEFKAEIKQLLHLLAFSLYKNKEIFLRELISNASDALSKLKYISLTDNDSIADKDERFEIEIEIDKDKKFIKVIDTGIGMTEEELINNIGTIAKSGTSEFLKLIEKNNIKDMENIGQFGVGFYSSFIVSDKVTIITKSYKPDSIAYEWTSDGSGSFTLKETEKKKRGTEVILHLKESEEEFLDKNRIENIVTKYSNFISFPILIEKGQVNKVEALWLKPKSSIKEEEYNGFFKLIGHSSDEPLFHEHIVAEAPYQFRALLFCPKKNFEIYGMMQNPDYGLSLYTSKVLIEQECKDLIPKYLRFIKGVVDSSDLPLNVSRESIQNNRIVIKIRTMITKRILARLADMLKNDKDKYLNFYKEYKNHLKEGLMEDFSNKEKISELLMFYSSKSEKEGLITLEEYVNRMYPEQKEIFYISGPDKESVENSPYIEIFKKKDIEVLYLYDPIDEITLNNIGEFKEKQFKSVEQANLDSLKDIKSKDSKDDEKQPEETKEDMKKINGLIKFMKKFLKDDVKDIVLSERLINSPYILVHPENGMSTQVEKMMKMMNKDFKGEKKILEVNPHSSFIKGLSAVYEKEKDSDFLKKVSSQIVDNAKLLEGSIENPLNTINRLNDIMEEAVKSKV
jgi:HSP90 family molecular chaperone